MKKRGNSNHLWILFLCILFFIVGISIYPPGRRRSIEGFTWSPDVERRFGLFQSTMNPRFFFDLSSIEQQASQPEAEYLLSKGIWPWDKITKNMFVDNVQTNPIVKTNPLATMQYARGIYNNQQAKELLSWTTPEGQLLLSGALIDNPDNHADDAWQNSYGISSGLVSPNQDIIRCEKVNKDIGGIDTYSLQRTRNLGNDGITQAHTQVQMDVDYHDLPDLIPGFAFSPTVGPCDPCVALQNPPDYSCPFSLHNGPQGISQIWKHLWGFK